MSKEAELREALEQARAKLVEQDEMLKELTAPPFEHGTVLSILDETVVLAVGQRVSEVRSKKKLKLSIGQTVRVGQSGAIVDAFPLDLSTGTICHVRKIVSEREVEVDIGGDVKTAFHQLPSLDEGDRVVVDNTGTVLLKNLGKQDGRFAFTEKTHVTWASIGGLEEAKAALIEAVELPYKHAKLYAAYGKKPIKGVLLYGPPGCGKTMLAKAVATAVSEPHGGRGRETAYIYVKGPELLDKYVGNTEAQIRSLFAAAREHHRKHGYPAVIFIDEADAIMGRRGDRGMGMEATVVPQFLSEMDGLEESGAFVLLSTNRADSLDPAIVRDGRISRTIHVGRPTEDSAAEIFSLNLRGKPGVTSGMAKSAARRLFETKVPGVNGAMIAGIVDKATSLAVHRDISTGGIGGISDADLDEAMVQTMAEQQPKTNSLTN